MPRNIDDTTALSNHYHLAIVIVVLTQTHRQHLLSMDRQVHQSQTPVALNLHRAVHLEFQIIALMCPFHPKRNIERALPDFRPMDSGEEAVLQQPAIRHSIHRHALEVHLITVHSIHRVAKLLLF